MTKQPKLDTTTPCICCADIWVYLDEHIDPATLAYLASKVTHSDDIATLHAELTALDGGVFPPTIDQLDRYIRGQTTS
jgi:hypothetical protein